MPPPTLTSKINIISKNNSSITYENQKGKNLEGEDLKKKNPLTNPSKLHYSH